MKSPPMKKPGEAGGAADRRALSEQISNRQFSAKSTATEAQRERILAALRRSPMTSYDLRRLGCYQAPARIKELRDRFGFRIETLRVTLVDRDGWTHPRAALYSLIAEPAGSAA